MNFINILQFCTPPTQYHTNLGTVLEVQVTWNNIEKKIFLTPWSRVLLEKLIGFQLIKKLPTFYTTWRFNTAFTSARHLSQSWASSIQSIILHSTSWWSILMLSFHLCLGLPSVLFLSGFPTRTLYTPLLSLKCTTCPAHLFLLNFITWTLLGEQYRS